MVKNQSVMLTAKAERRDVLDAKHEGVDAYIVKPFTPLDILRKIGALASKMAV